MDYVFVIQIIKSILRELWRRKYLAMAVGTVVAFACLAVGYFWQEKFEVNTTLYADSQDIISPLLKGQANATSVENQRQLVRDIMLSSKILDKVVREEGFLTEEDATDLQNLPARISIASSSLRNNVEVRMLGKNYVGVSYTDTDPERAFGVVNRLVDHFITESSASKKSESQKAFTFIDKQARAYQAQLRDAEDRLKVFKATNIDGTEAQVNSKIERLRDSISTLSIDIEQIDTRIQSLRSQIANEDKYLTQRAKADEYNQRIVEAVKEYDNLRLTFTESHPDVIALKQYIEELRAASLSDASGGTISTGVENPVYDQLRGAMANAQIEKRAEQRRLNSLNNLLDQEIERKQRIAEKNAELAELESGYDVTKDLYEDLLERKEQARMSMALDIEGQGVSYQIQEPPMFPVVPVGLSYVHFVLLGALAAIAVPMGLIVAYILLDPRVRFNHNVQENYNIDLLGEIPHYVSAADRVAIRNSSVLYLIVGCLLAAAYIASAFAIRLVG